MAITAVQPPTVPAHQIARGPAAATAPPPPLLGHPAAWTPASIRALPESEWIYTFTKDDIAALEKAGREALSSGRPLEAITRADVSLPAQLASTLEGIQHEASWGRGFALLRGLPVTTWPRDLTTAVWWLIGLHWGAARSINKQGHLIGSIKDLGQDPDSPTTRLYATNAAQPYHNDGPADLVALLCLAQAKEGGASHWSSSVSVFNAIARSRPELLPLLAARDAWFFDRKGEVPPGKQPYFEIPVFNFNQRGDFACNFSSNYFFLSQRHADLPRLTPAQLEAIKVFEDLAQSDELRLDWLLQPGDIQLLSNHVALHARGAFTDGPLPGQQRHLLRLWLSPASERELPSAYSEIMGGSLEVGNRGGILYGGTRPHVPLEDIVNA